MDAVGMDSLVEILQDYSDRKDTGLVIVSHKAKGDLFNRQWFVNKDEDGFSNVTVKE
jgi:hypothetical protein